MTPAPADAPPADMPDAPRTDELRLALVLNGGVSLAVWMGGVVFELNRLVRETHPVYRGLLALTGTAARIDVISGTSAGGINGAALALAQVYDRSLYSLRDVWLDTGGLENLLQPPDAPELRSLLRGDDWFLPRIHDALKALADTGEPAPPAQVPLELNLTSTLLDGLSHRSADDFGAEIEDTVHRVVWQFRHLEAQDDFTDKRLVEQLAFAARSTASFPVAFEPTLYEPAGRLFQGAPRLRMNQAPCQAVSERAYLLDGGILDNKPFEAALRAIARLPAVANTRRVLAYVVPDPAASAEARPQTPDQALVPPTLAETAWRSLVSIPGAQSIGNHMAELREHNQRMTRRWQRIVGAVVHMRADGLLASARASLPAYQARRVDGIIDYCLEETERRLAAAVHEAAPGEPAPVVGMRRATRQWLASTWRQSARLGRGQDMPERWASRIPGHFDTARSLLAPGAWHWGLYALQFTAEFSTELLRRTQRLQALVSRWQHPARSAVNVPGLDLAGTPGAAPATAASPVFDDLAEDRRRSPAHAAMTASGRLLADTPLKDHWQRAYELSGQIQERRRLADQAIGRIGHEGFVALVRQWQQSGGEQPPEPAALALIEQLLRVSEEGVAYATLLARRLCRLLADLQPKIDEVLEAHRQRRGPGRRDIDEAAAELAALRRYLYEPTADEARPAGDAPDPQLLDRIAWRVMALEVFEVSAGSRREAPGAPAEVVQISARLASAFGGSADPARKLSGMQLAHFGAFYKRSWRANDWTYGRLDGIDRAIRIALNPDALQKRFGNRMILLPGRSDEISASEYLREVLHDLAVAGAEPALQPYLQSLWTQDEPALRQELAWLDQEATVPPPVLTLSARALTRRLQLEALRRELPEIARSLLVEQTTGSPPSVGAGAPLLAQVKPADSPGATPPTPELAVRLVQADLLGSETLAQQLGTDRMTRTASQGLATAHAALSSKAGGLSALGVLFRLTEWPLRVLYWLANRLSGGGNTAVALEALALGVGAALVAAAGLSEKLPGPVLAFGWALLTGAVATSLLRDPPRGAALVVVLVTTLFVLDRMTLALAGTVALATLLLLTPFGPVLSLLVMLAVAAWWSAGASTDAALQLWQKLAPWAAPPAPMGPPTRDELQQAEAARQALARLESTLWPALLLGGMLSVFALQRALLDVVTWARRQRARFRRGV